MPKNFGIKKEESSTTATTQNAIGDINEDSSKKLYKMLKMSIALCKKMNRLKSRGPIPRH